MGSDGWVRSNACTDDFSSMHNCLAGAIDSRERIITCAEVFELRIAARDVVALQSRQPSVEGTGEIPLRRLMKESLRMRPSRIIVGEVRQEESLDMLLALNSGLPGMCTVHANSAREAIAKMCTLPLLAGENFPIRKKARSERDSACCPCWSCRECGPWSELSRPGPVRSFWALRCHRRDRTRRRGSQPAPGSVARALRVSERRVSSRSPR